MHPILAHRRRLVLYLGGWLLIAGLLSALVTYSGGFSWGGALAVAVPMTFVYAFLSLSTLYMCRAFPLQNVRFERIAVIYLAAASLSSALWVLLGRVWVSLLFRIGLTAGLESAFDAQAGIYFGSGVLLFLLAVAVHYLIIEFENARLAERRSFDLLSLAREAELRALKAQLQPHFLFNSLNSISALTRSDPAAARQMCVRLAEFFRRTLASGKSADIPLPEELALVEDFLSIEQVRFGPRLKFSKDVSPEAAVCLIPSLLLQPLVENAVNHGIAGMIEGGTITLRAERSHAHLRISLTNPVDPESKPGRSNGVGLKNVQARLAALYGNEAGVEIDNSGGLYRVAVVFPARTADAHITQGDADDGR
jgi:hypothetical protein